MPGAASAARGAPPTYVRPGLSTARPPANWAPASPDAGSLLRATTILFLVAAILQWLAAGLSAVIVGLATLLEGLTDEPLPSDLATYRLLYAIAGPMFLAAGFCSLAARRAAKRGDARGAFRLGMWACLLPPLQMVPLIAAILARVSPQHDGTWEWAPDPGTVPGKWPVQRARRL